MNKTIYYEKKALELIKLLTLPYMIGFVQGHYYLTHQQILYIKQVLNSDTNNKGFVRDYEQRMSDHIGNGYGISFASGRMAFYTILKTMNIGKGDEVILPAFTCSVMPNAIWRTGATPVFAEIDTETFGSDAAGIKKKITPRTKAIVAQHSFGIPCNINEIVELAEKYGIYVIEDCAITFDSTINGIKVGNLGDAAIFSTDHSKPINTIIGGFFYSKNRSLYEKVKVFASEMPQLDNRHQERLYDQFLFEHKYYTPKKYPRSIILNNFNALKRKLSSGKKEFTFLEGDYKKQVSQDNNYPYPAKMPSFLAQIGIFELERWEKEKKHRKNILNQYLDIISQSSSNKFISREYFNPEKDIVPLRFVFQHPDHKNMMKRMSQFIDVKWTWFKEPIICCPDGPVSLGYNQGTCNKAEKACNEIINWPCVLEESWDSKLMEIFCQILKDKT